MLERLGGAEFLKFHLARAAGTLQGACRLIKIVLVAADGHIPHLHERLRLLYLLLQQLLVLEETLVQAVLRKRGLKVAPG